MRLTFLTSAPASKCCVHGFFSRPVAALHFNSGLRAGEDILKNKHFLVCRSHTPTHSVAPVSTPSDIVTSVVRLVNKLRPPCTRESLRASCLLIYICIYFFPIACNMGVCVWGGGGVGGGGVGGQQAAGAMEEKEMHQPGICPGFYFHALGCSSART